MGAGPESTGASGAGTPRAETPPAGAPPPIAVLGAGSWGTALAIQLARSGRATRLWGRDSRQLSVLARDRVNARYLPDAAFPVFKTGWLSLAIT